ncbi:ATP-binding protein [candidate division CSSED10-310 bacterium]|uniref:histidine kinase n=1 Tax=candidate division CSSED10-310 bacterium TaxID=2855610 RepID=A0ABV6Z0Q2_UNCC1
MTVKLKELKSSNEFLNLVLDNITAAIFIIDKNHRIQSVNGSFRSLFQKTEEQVLGQLCGHALDCSFSIEEKKDCLKTPECKKCSIRKSIFEAFTAEVPVHKAKLDREFLVGGQPVRKHLQFSTSYINYNEQEMVLVIVDDMTELEEQKKRLQELNSLKDKFLGIAAHDLRSPISVIKMYSDSMIKFFNQNLSQEQLKFLNLVNETSDFMLSLVDDFLDLATIESGQLILNRQHQDYVGLVRHSVEMNNIIATQKNISLEPHISTEIPALCFDRYRLEQVINNLISNAVKFSEPGSRVKVIVEKNHQHIKTYIQDTGPGIPNDEIAYVFDAFRTTSVNSTAAEKQTGLGLAIAKKIVEGHQGTLEVSSEVGQGTTFSFTLPLSED